MAAGIRYADHAAPLIRKSWQSLRRQAAVAIVRSRTQTMELLLPNSMLPKRIPIETYVYSVELESKAIKEMFNFIYLNV
jgi:hypothetical protein